MNGNNNNYITQLVAEVMANANVAVGGQMDEEAMLDHMFQVATVQFCANFAQAGNIELVRSILVDQGIPVDAETMKGVTLLTAAIMGNQMGMIRYLVEECGANVNHRSRNGMCPMACATVGVSNLEIIQYLVDHGADVNFEHSHFSSLGLAIMTTKDKKIIRYFLEQGVDIHFTTPEVQQTAFWNAITYDLDWGYYLLDVAGIDINHTLSVAITTPGTTKLESLGVSASLFRKLSKEDNTQAARRLHGWIVKLVGNGVNIYGGDSTVTPLRSVLNAPIKDTFQFLYQAGGEVSSAKKDTLMMILVEDIELLKWVMDKDSELLPANEAWKLIKDLLPTQFSWADPPPTWREFLLLLLKHPSVDKQCQQALETLLSAVANGIVDAVRLLVQNGVPVDLPDQYGHTALFHAAMHGRIQVADCLLKELGANYHLKNHEGKGVKDLAFFPPMKQYLSTYERSLSQTQTQTERQRETHTIAEEDDHNAVTAVRGRGGRGRGSSRGRGGGRGRGRGMRGIGVADDSETALDSALPTPTTATHTLTEEERQGQSRGSGRGQRQRTQRRGSKEDGKEDKSSSKSAESVTEKDTETEAALEAPTTHEVEEERQCARGRGRGSGKGNGRGRGRGRGRQSETFGTQPATSNDKPDSASPPQKRYRTRASKSNAKKSGDSS